MQVIAGFLAGLEFVQLGSLGFRELIFEEFFRKLLEVNSADDFARSIFLNIWWLIVLPGHSISS